MKGGVLSSNGELNLMSITMMTHESNMLTILHYQDT